MTPLQFRRILRALYTKVKLSSNTWTQWNRRSSFLQCFHWFFIFYFCYLFTFLCICE